MWDEIVPVVYTRYDHVICLYIYKFSLKILRMAMSY